MKPKPLSEDDDDDGDDDDDDDAPTFLTVCLWRCLFRLLPGSSFS